MSEKREELDELIQVPVGKTLKEDVQRFADREERSLGGMARIFIREAVSNRKGEGKPGEEEPEQSDSKKKA